MQSILMANGSFFDFLFSSIGVVGLQYSIVYGRKCVTMCVLLYGILYST
jgi:hypothetical protein